MEETNMGQMGSVNSGRKSPAPVVVIIVVIIAVVIGVYFLLSNNSETPTPEEKPQEEQTLGEQISGGVTTDNPASEVPQANVFETETNPFSDGGFKNPFE